MADNANFFDIVGTFTNITLIIATPVRSVISFASIFGGYKDKEN